MNKKLSLASVAAALAALAFIPAPAKAGDEGLAALGGFIGGVIVGSHIGHDREIRPPAGPRFERRYEAPRHSSRPSGHWETVRTKVWVPGRTYVRFDRHGHRERVVERGHYEYRNERVWVAEVCSR